MGAVTAHWCHSALALGHLLCNARGSSLPCVKSSLAITVASSAGLKHARKEPVEKVVVTVALFEVEENSRSSAVDKIPYLSGGAGLAGLPF